MSNHETKIRFDRLFSEAIAETLEDADRSHPWELSDAVLTILAWQVWLCAKINNLHVVIEKVLRYVDHQHSCRGSNGDKPPLELDEFFQLFRVDEDFEQTARRIVSTHRDA